MKSAKKKRKRGKKERKVRDRGKEQFHKGIVTFERPRIPGSIFVTGKGRERERERESCGKQANKPNKRSSGLN